MGSWGAGLYSDDCALDLRDAVAAVAKLPLGDDEVLDLLRTTELEIDAAKLDRRRKHLTGGGFGSVRGAALGDICISNELSRPYKRDRGFWNRPPHVVARLAALARPVAAG